MLRQALPYFRKFSGSVIVLKFSGKNLSAENFRNIVWDIAVLKSIGAFPVIVHGAGPQIEDCLPKSSLKKDGLRVTTKEEITIIEKLIPQVSEHVVDLLREFQLEGQIINEKIFSLCKKDFGDDIDFEHYTGEIKGVNADEIFQSFKAGKIPIFSSCEYDQDHRPYNINADTMAVSLAVELKAKKLIFFSDVEGVLDKQNRKISVIPLKNIPFLKSENIITGGMIPKIDACRDAILAGVGRCHIISGQNDGAMLKEIFTREGAGTLILEDPNSYRHIRRQQPEDEIIFDRIFQEDALFQKSFLPNMYQDDLVRDRFVFEIDHQIIGAIEIYYSDAKLIISQCSQLPNFEEYTIEKFLLERVEKFAKEKNISEIFLVGKNIPDLFFELGFCYNNQGDIVKTMV